MTKFTVRRRAFFSLYRHHEPWVTNVTLFNTWINKSRDWHIDGVANKSSVWFFISTNLQKIPVKISWHSHVWSTSYSDLSDASLDILKTIDSKQFRVLIYHCFMMKKNTVQAQQWLEKCYGHWRCFTLRPAKWGSYTGNHKKSPPNRFRKP